MVTKNSKYHSAPWLKAIVLGLLLFLLPSVWAILAAPYEPAPLTSEIAKLVASDAAQTDVFGLHLVVQGNEVFVGASHNDEVAADAGAVYIYQQDLGGPDSWGELKKLTASDGQASDHFGIFIDVEGDTLVVGSYYDDDNGTDSGSAYIFDRNQGGPDSWGQVKKLTAFDGAAGGRYGKFVSLNGDTLVVGAREDTVGPGSAYIYERNRGGTNNWGLVTKITASGGALNDYFGHIVSISGDTIAVGARGDDAAGEESGSAYIFERDSGGTDNWGQVKKITASDAGAGDNFGNSISLEGDTLIVGSPKDDDGGTDSGSVYIFERDSGGLDNWGQVKKITASDAGAGDNFGQSLVLNGDALIIGAHLDTDNGTDSGSAYLFLRNQGGTDNWGELDKLIASDGVSGDWYGFGVGVDGTTVVVGAYKDDDACPINPSCNSGSAYVYYQIAIPTVTPSVTNTPTPTVTGTPPTSTPTPIATDTPTPAPTSTLTPIITNTPIPAPTSTLMPIITNTPTPVQFDVYLPLVVR